MAAAMLCLVFASLQLQVNGGELRAIPATGLEVDDILKQSEVETELLEDGRIHSKQRSQRPVLAASPTVQAMANASEVTPIFKLPETIEDVEARWLGVAFDHMVWFLSESPLSCAQKASTWLLSADKHPADRSHHQSLALRVLQLLGVNLAHEHQKQPVNQAASKADFQSPHAASTMFGGLPWLLIVPVILGIGLAAIIQVVSLYYEWQERQEKLMKGEPLEPEPTY